MMAHISLLQPIKTAKGALERQVGSLRVAFLGDVVGRPGREALKQCMLSVKDELAIDLVIANGENAAGGAGIDAKTALEIRGAGVDLITLGDHAFQRKGVSEFLQQHQSWCIRPLNSALGAPGVGWCVRSVTSHDTVLLVNLLGRVFVNGTQLCPFRAVDELLLSDEARAATVIIVDFHAEATSEKWAMARHLDGRASLLVGTHTHVQTADAQVLPGGLGYITDLGMCGSNNGVIGMKAEVALRRFLSPLPAPYEIAEGSLILHGVVADLALTERRALWISPLRVDLPFETVSPDSSRR